MILAAIDIGSNAARLLISNATEYTAEQTEFTKLNLLRIPLRLGIDVFNTGRISDGKIKQLIDTMQAYKLMMTIYKVDAVKACATSAMRDAVNGHEVIKTIKEKTGIDIQIISGSEEASIVYETHIAEKLNNKRSYLYIDVGGGSTELTLFAKSDIVFKESFNIGTIRMLSDRVTGQQWDQLKSFVKGHTRSLTKTKAIGSGGNINKVFSLSRHKEGSMLPLSLLQNYYREFSGLSVSERMQQYGLREDRADVIVPALKIYTSIMRWAGCDEIFVPKIGLVDGLTKMLYQETRKVRSGT